MFPGIFYLDMCTLKNGILPWGERYWRMKEEERDLKQVIKAEKQRGLRPVALSRQKQRELLDGMARLLEVGREQDFVRALQEDFGITEGSPQFASALRIWRDQH